METLDFCTTMTTTNQYSVPVKDLKKILNEDCLNYEDMDSIDLEDYIRDNEEVFSNFLLDTDIDYAGKEVEIF